jgi:hypothetical protein
MSCLYSRFDEAKTLVFQSENGTDAGKYDCRSEWPMALVVYQHKGRFTGEVEFVNVLEENLSFKLACEMTAELEQELND